MRLYGVVLFFLRFVGRYILQDILYTFTRLPFPYVFSLSNSLPSFSSCHSCFALLEMIYL